MPAAKQPGQPLSPAREDEAWAGAATPVQRRRGTLARQWFLAGVGGIAITLFWLWLVILLPDASEESARWTLSAIVQAAAAIIGTTFVALTFIWREAQQAGERLRLLRSTYLARLEGGDRYVAVGKGERRRVGDLEHLLGSIDSMADDGRLTVAAPVPGAAEYKSCREWIADLYELH